ncbi:MAG: ABC transporter ATP-binding protein [Clostridia bacterium]|jgi:ATP-binding cassette subfamily B protein|nr:ABC transporter ATP-binding protein [Clostridia bacterium]MBQ5957509.1 ABC transporter ATP-binding protein [Clostridia bacterium]MBR3563176.1 ABC transporter ATP-binding protein [Clostridia bacterium]MBR4623461.1 ABC transporter ATP-binding protein [Clostridia bacterium]MBR6822401.1 ABC transporter ATP-binding protein [Clostridia bacterium]
MNYLQEEDFNQKVNLGTWKRLLKYALRHKGMLFTIISSLFVSSFVDILYPLMTKYAIDNFITTKQIEGFVPYVIISVILIVIQAICSILFVRGGSSLELSMSYEIRQESFEKLQRLSFSYYDKTSVGYIMARVMSDTSRLSEMIAWSIVDVLYGLTFIIGCIITMFTLNVKLALITLSVIPVMTAVAIFFRSRILRQYRLVRKINSRITSSYNEGIMGAMTTKTLVREDQNYEDFKVLTTDMRREASKASRLNSIFFPIIMLLSSIGTSLALGVGGLEVLGEMITFGTLSSFITYTSQFFEPIQSITSIFAELQNAQASAERVISLLDTEEDITDTEEVIEKYGDSINPKPENWPPIKGDISFEHVNFSYIPEEIILEDFNLEIPAGSSVALVGETGAGKSTLVNLVCRFYEPTSGSIKIDGVDYRERSQIWLQSNTGYVLQQPHLFSGTIRDNIAYGKKDATEEEIRNAARMVKAEEFILAQKDGYDTEVGEGGIRLSTGQKQLISFARVILSDPRIFVLDEATSSIDTETEQLIQEAITTVLQNRTSLIVAHRLSTIRHADMILVIGNKGIIEKGTHEELLAKKGAYYNLYTHQ